MGVFEGLLQLLQLIAREDGPTHIHEAGLHVEGKIRFYSHTLYIYSLRVI